MLNNSAPGQPVYEPFSGSGTTLIAAETCGRISLSMELDSAYVDVAVTRWQGFTGKAATLDGDGRSFAEIASSGCRHEGQPGPPAQAHCHPQARRQPRQARLEPRRARAARRHPALPQAPRAGRPHRVAAGCAGAPRHGGADPDRPGGARRLLPELRQVGRGREQAQGDPAAPEDALGLRPAVARGWRSPTSSSRSWAGTWPSSA